MAVETFTDRLDTQLKGRSVSKEMTMAAFPPTPPPETSSGLLWSNSRNTSRSGSPSPLASEPIVAVIGVGYVGTHLVEAFAHHYRVLAFDLSEKRLAIVAEDLKNPSICFTTNPREISEASHILISVPTVLNEDKTIDTTYLRSAIATVEQYVKPGSTVVIESSVAVGMTRQLVGPLMASKNLKVGMSPEVRITFTLIRTRILTHYSELIPAALSRPSKTSQRLFLV